MCYAINSFLTRCNMLHELGMFILAFVCAIGIFTALYLIGSLVLTVPISLCLTPFAVFGWRGDRLNKYRQHLHRCVVEDNCPRGDDVLHRYIEKTVWALDQHFGLFGLIPATFVWWWIDLFRTFVHPLEKLCRDFTRTLSMISHKF